MKLKFLLSFVLFVLFQISYTQVRTEGVLYERNDDKSIDFTYSKNNPGSVFVILKFKNLTNASSRVVKETIKGYSGSLTTLEPDNPNESIGFSYSYRIVHGNVDAKPDLNFKYILPFKYNRSVKVRNLSYLGKRFGGTEPKNWKSFQFLAEPNDTVYAIRKGVVVRVEDGHERKSGNAEYGYRNKNNYLIIEHEDGTLASYGVLKNNSIMVEVGDAVYPSAPLAVAGTYDKDKNSQVRLSIYYLDEIVKTLDFDENSKEPYGKGAHLNAYVNPYFVVNSNETLQLEKNKTYTGFCNNEIIEAEMSKRELKKWKKNNELVKR